MIISKKRKSQPAGAVRKTATTISKKNIFATAKNTWSEKTDNKVKHDSFEVLQLDTVNDSAVSQDELAENASSSESPRSILAQSKSTTITGNAKPKIDSIQTGLTAVRLNEEQYLQHVTFAFLDLVIKKSHEIGIPMPECESVTLVCSGNRRNLDEVQRFAAAHPQSSKNIPYVIKTCASQHKLDWTSAEGQHVLQPIIDGANGWVILNQVIAGSLTPAITQGLIQIGNSAKNVGVFVMLILVCQKGVTQTDLMNVCHEYIEVTKCEPDAGVDIAFSIDCVGIRDMNCHGIGRTMCDVKLTEGGYRRRYAPFISGELESRIMWYLRGKGHTLDQIASRLNVNKSTVSRRLMIMPKPLDVDLGPDWLSDNLD